MTKVKITLAEGIPKPIRGSDRAAAFDLMANIPNPVDIRAGETMMVPTGVSLDMSADPGLAALLLPRSGLGAKWGLVLGNGIGLIDNDYTGEISIAAWNRNPALLPSGMGQKTGEVVRVEPGMRLAQLMFLNVPDVTLETVTAEKVTKTKRGDGGFGSTGA